MRCPCCHGSGKIEAHSSLPVYLPPTQAKIYRMVQAAPEVINGWRLVELLYRDRADGGPEFALDCVHGAIRLLNKKLKPVGQRVRADRRGPGATYRIVNI